MTTHFFKQCVQLQGDHASRVLAKGMIQQFLEKFVFVAFTLVLQGELVVVFSCE